MRISILRVTIYFILTVLSGLSFAASGKLLSAERVAKARTRTLKRLHRKVEASIFRPIDEEVRSNAVGGLVDAVERLHQVRGDVDAEQLEWLGLPHDSEDGLDELLADEEWLVGIRTQLEQDFEPFEHAAYQELLTALQTYLRVLKAQQHRDLALEFEQRRRDMQVLLDSTQLEYRQRRLADHVVWLEERLQAPELVASLKKDFSHPNAILSVPADALARISAQEISQQDVFSESSRQLRTSGTTRLSGRARLAPQSKGAPVRVEFPGIVQLSAVSRLGPFSFSSWGRTRVRAELDLRVSEEGLELVESARVSARTQLRVGRVRARRRGPLAFGAGRMLDRVVEARRDEAVNEVNRTVSRRIKTEFEKLAEEQLPSLNRQYQRQFVHPATRLQMRPRSFDVDADESRVVLRVTEDRHCGLAAPRREDFNDVGHSPFMAFHSSFASDLLNALFRGQNWPRDVDANGLQSFNDQLPVAMFESREFVAEPRIWLRLHERRPFRVRFDDGRIVLVLQAEKMSLDNETLQDVGLRLPFKLDANGQTVTLRLAEPPSLEIAANRDVSEETLAEFTQACRHELLAALKSEVTLPAELRRQGWAIRPHRLISKRQWFTVVAEIRDTPLQDAEEELQAELQDNPTPVATRAPVDPRGVVARKDQSP